MNVQARLINTTCVQRLLHMKPDGFASAARSLVASAIVAAFALTALPARAQFGGMLAPPANILQGSAFITQNDLSRAEQLRQARLKAARQGRAGKDSQPAAQAAEAAPKTPEVSTLVGRSAGAAQMPQKLAEAYPPASRAQAEQLFRQLLQDYNRIEQRFGIPHGDTAGALAAFIAGSYMAYRKVDFPDEHFAALVEQMRGVLRQNADFRSSAAPQRQALWEQCAIVGMFMATGHMAVQARPDPQAASSLRAAAQSYLEAFLHTDADRLRLTEHGLSLR